MNRTELKLKPNEPVTVRLKHPEPKKLSNFFNPDGPPRLMYMVDDGRILFLPGSIEEQIKKHAGRPFQICKTVKDGQTRYVTSPVIEEPMPALPPSQQPSPKPEPTRKPISTRILAGCLISAFDAAKTLEDYATHIGRPVAFTPAEIQRMGISLYIAHAGEMRKQLGEAA